MQTDTAETEDLHKKIQEEAQTGVAHGQKSPWVTTMTIRHFLRVAAKPYSENEIQFLVDLSDTPSSSGSINRSSLPRHQDTRKWTEEVTSGESFFLLRTTDNTTRNRNTNRILWSRRCHRQHVNQTTQHLNNIMQVNDCMNSKGAEQLQHSWTSHRGENEILATIMTDVFGDKLSASWSFYFRMELNGWWLDLE